MAFAIMRAKKLNGMGAVAASLQHCYRDRDTPNAAVSAQNARRNRELQETMVGQRERIKALQEPFQGLSREQFKELVIAAAGMRRENEAAKAAKLQRQKERRQERPDRSRGFSR